MPQDVVGFRFGNFEADLRSGELLKAGVRVRLQDQPLRILRTLLERPGELVTREELRRLLWPADTFVDFDRGLNNAMSRLREALGDSAESPRFIETLARRGYRFIAPVEPISASPRPLPAAATTIGRTDASLATPTRSRHRLAPVLFVVAVVLVLGLTSGALVRGRRTSATVPTEKTMLVVLPFENLSGDAEQEYLSDGLTEEMIARLGEFDPQRLGVIARTSAIRYKGRGKDLKTIASELGVEYALEGSVRRAGNRVRITAQLIDTSDLDHVWAQSYERQVRDVLDLQIEIARSIAREIRLIASEAARPRGEVDPEAYALYLKGRFLAGKRTTQALRHALSCLEEAARRDQRYAPIRASLAQAHLLAARYEVSPPREALGAARRAAESALLLDPSSSQALGVLGYVRLYADWDWNGARAAFERALQLNPSDATARLWYGYSYLRGRGDYDGAIAQLRRAQTIDPLSKAVGVALAETYLDAGRGAAALDQSRRLLEAAPDFHIAFIEQGRALEMLGQYEAAEESLKRGVELGGGSLTPVVELARFQAARGRRAEARRVLAAADTARRRFAPALPQARLQAALGDVGATLALLEKAIEERPIDLESLKHDPAFASLRSEPRFAAIVRRIGPQDRPQIP